MNKYIVTYEAIDNEKGWRELREERVYGDNMDLQGETLAIYGGKYGMTAINLLYVFNRVQKVKVKKQPLDIGSKNN